MVNNIQQPSGNQQRDTSAAKLGAAQKAMITIAMPSIPNKMKTELWNRIAAPALGEVIGGGLPEFDEWPPEMDDIAKKASKILSERKLPSEDKVAALKALAAEAEEDISLAPGLESFRLQQDIDKDWETHQMLEMMTSGRDGIETTDEDVVNFAAIRERNPGAAVRAAEILDDERAERGR